MLKIENLRLTLRREPGGRNFAIHPPFEIKFALFGHLLIGITIKLGSIDRNFDKYVQFRLAL